MIDWRIAKIASSGMRGMRFRFRQPMTRLSVTIAEAMPPAATRRGQALVRRVMRPPRRRDAGLASSSAAPRRARSATGRRRRASGGAGRCRRWRSPPRRGRARPGPAPWRRPRRGRSARGCARRASTSPLPQAARIPVARWRSSRRWTTTSIRSPPTCDLSSSAVPRAMILPWSTTAIVSASSSASSRYCVVSRSVVPSRTRPRMTSHIPSRLRGSRPVVGSSRNSSRGRPMSALPRSSRRRMPPE